MLGIDDPVLTLSVVVSVFFLSVYVLAFFVWKRRKAEIPEERLPGVSIVVPAYNEEENIADTIESLLGLDYPKDRLEIIVVDDGSTDRTCDVAKKYEGDRVKVIRKENGGKSSALNAGIRAAKYDVIACMDADSVATGKALKTLVSYIVEENADAVTPVMHVWKPRNLIEKFQWAEYILSNVMRRALDTLQAQYVTPGPFSLFKKECFEKYGYFDEDNITEDMEMAMRIQAKGGKIVHASDAIVYTKVPRDIVSLIKQRVRWNLGFLENAWKYRREIWKNGGDMGIFVFPAIFVGLFITFLLAYKMAKDFMYHLEVITTTVSMGGIWSLIKPASWDFSKVLTSTLFGLASFPPAYYTTVLLAAITVAMIVYYAKKTGEPRVYWSGIYVLVSFYFFFMLVVWTIILLVKIFGREVRFGGTVWRNSVLNQLAGKYTAVQR